MFRLANLFLVALMLAVIPVARADDAADADAQLAERMADLGQRVLRDKNVDDLQWRQARELVKAAVRLAPSEQRFARLLADIQLELKDFEGAKEALNAYRAINPSDAFAQIQLIDLYVGKMETADARINYLRDIMGRATLPAEVRSHAAFGCSQLLREQGQIDAFPNTLDQSIRLDNLNPGALRAKLELVRASGTPLEHVNVLLSLVKSNPTQAEVIQELGDRVASLGLNDWSIYWYSLSFQLLNRTGQIDPDQMVNYVSALFLQDRLQDASGLNDQLLKIRPENIDLQYLRVLMNKSSMKKEDRDAAMQKALNALYNQLAVVRSKIGVAGATTRPFDQADAPVIPDLSGDVELIKAAKPEVVSDYVRAASDLAWFQLYFQKDAAAAEKIINVLKGLLPAESITLNRLVGWQFYVSGKTTEAKDKFSEIDDRDPLAAMGLILILEKDPQQSDKARSMARRVISENAAGIRGALLWDGLRDHGAKIVLSQVGEAVNDELNKFPKEFLRVIDMPQNFYAIKGEPNQPSYGYNEPMLAKVSLQNLTDYPITIGPLGVIKRDMWFDAQTKGLVQQAFPGVTYDRFGQHVVLAPRSTLTQTVRLDRGALQQAMSSNPTIPLQISFSMTTNPLMQNSQILSGLCGYRSPFARLFSRNGNRMQNDEDKQKALHLLTEGTPAQKFSTIELLAIYATSFRSNNANPQMQQVGNDFLDAINRVRRDSSPSISAWASYVSAQAQPDNAKGEIFSQMFKSEQWTTRLAAVCAAPVLPADQGKTMLKPLADSDADPLVRTMAGLQIEQLNRPPTTQPTTMPASFPTTLPVE